MSYDYELAAASSFFVPTNLVYYQKSLIFAPESIKSSRYLLADSPTELNIIALATVVVRCGSININFKN